MTIAELRAEIVDDPAGLGYVAGGAWKPDTEIAGLLNDPALGAAMWRERIPMPEVYAAVSWNEVVALLPANREAFRLITSTEHLDASSANVRAAFAAIFAVGTASRAALQALATRQGSRAEVLWGDGAHVTAGDVGRAANG